MGLTDDWKRAYWDRLRDDDTDDDKGNMWVAIEIKQEQFMGSFRGGAQSTKIGIGEETRNGNLYGNEKGRRGGWVRG